MGVTRLENIFRTRDWLGRPLPNSPSFHDILRQEISTEMDILNKTNNSGRPWALSTYQLNYTPGQDTYAINVTDWGKAVYVERLQGDSYIRYLAVDFSDVNDLSYGTVWQYPSNSFGQTPWMAVAPERMSFYRQGVLNAQATVRIQPEPQTSWTYLIHYLPGVIGNQDPLESAVQMPEHATLAQLRNAASLLALAEWSTDEEKDERKRARLEKSFAYQLSIKEPFFREYIKSITIPRVQAIEDCNGGGGSR